MERQQGPLPHEARSAAEFVACMRELKQQAGLTYRQLEADAERRGDVLARSTVADLLRRDSLPRAEVVAAFVRACGRDEDIADWLDARNRLAAAEPSDPDGAPAPEPATRPSVAGRIGNRRVLAASAGAALLLAAVGAWALLPDERGDRDGTTSAAGVAPRPAPSASPDPTADPEGPAPGRSRIRPVVAPQLCLTEGHDRKGRYRSQIAAQRPCADATPPDLSLVSVGTTGSYYIQWRHPVQGDGCLTALGSGHVVEGLLEPWPWESCSADRTSQHFYFDRVGDTESDGYRIHVVQNGMCLGVNGTDDRAAGAEIAQQRCTGARDQEFLVEAVD
ncbi:helix-turn-helix domain-containing protein [Streptomyces sp. SudanB52_2052]|uniref:helix-turn-helix domain-containing protein n=1 Tax=Streptomyces sp. SudanB52_2052 TaxID=3035276 RepID=UPI003F56D8E7